MKTISIALSVACLMFGSSSSWAGLFSVSTNYSVGTAPTSVCLANLRGKQTFRDLVVANSTADTVSIRLCLDDGTFGQRTDYAVGTTPASVRYGDLNSDRQDDLVTANAGTNTVSVLVNLGVGANFRAATNFVVGSTVTSNPRDVAIGDVNGDGRPDVVTANFGEDSVSVLTNRGGAMLGGLLNYSVGVGPSSIFLGDMDLDDKLDVVTANQTDGTVTIRPGNGDGTFDAAQTVTYASGGDPQPVSIYCRDLDGDGVLDIVLANYNEQTVTVLLGSAPGGVWAAIQQDDYAAGTNPSSLTVRDLNHDGIVDIGFVNTADDNFQVLLGDGTGSFIFDAVYPTGGAPSAVASSNLNGDEAADVVVVNGSDDDVTVLLFSAPLAYNATVTSSEDVPKAIVLRGAMLGTNQLIFQTNGTPIHGSLTLSGSNVVYTPETNYFGTDSFNYVTICTNDASTSAVATITLSVLAVNDRPSFTLATNYVSVWEDSTITNIPLFIADTNVGPANEAGQTVVFLLTPSNRADYSGTPSISPAGTLLFRPAINATGAKTISIVARDSGGTARGGSNASPAQTLTIDIIPNPVKPLKGSYSGLFYETNGFAATSAGFFTFSMNYRGGFSGRVTSESGRDAFSGQFDPSGYVHTQVIRNNNSTLDVDLQLDISGGSDRVLGSVTDGNWVANLEGDRLVFNAATNPATEAGRYTMVIPGDINTPGVPAGDSYGALNVTSNGVITMSGRLSDGTTISQSVGLSKNGQWPFYTALYGYRGVIMGWIQFTNAPATSLDGGVYWSKTAFASTFYPGGFDLATSVVGSTYVAPGSGQRVVAVTNALLTLDGGEITGAPVTIGGVFATNNTASFTNGASMRLINPSTGVVDGVFRHPSLLLNKKFYGVALQQQNELRGYFPGASESGSFRVVNY